MTPSHYVIVVISLATLIFNAPVSGRSIATVKSSASVSKKNLEIFMKNGAELSEFKSIEASVSGDGTSSVSSSVFNLAKTILGAGILSLPSGIYASIYYYFPRKLTISEYFQNKVSLLFLINPLL